LHFTQEKNGPNRPWRRVISPPHSKHVSVPSGQVSTTGRPVRVHAKPGGGGPKALISSRERRLALPAVFALAAVFLPFRAESGSGGASGISPFFSSSFRWSSLSMGMALRQRGNPEQDRNGPRRLLRMTIDRPHLTQRTPASSGLGFSI